MINNVAKIASDPLHSRDLLKEINSNALIGRNSNNNIGSSSNINHGLLEILLSNNSMMNRINSTYISTVNNTYVPEFVDGRYNNNFSMMHGDLMEPWAYHLAALTLFLIGFFGFSLNAIVIMLMCKNIKLWTPTNIILLNLVCSDFLVSIFGNPFTFIAALSHRWIFGRVLCIAYGFFMALLGITSITTLTILAYERYCLIQFPLSSSKIGNRGAVICIIFIWLYSLALTTPPLFGWGAYVNEAADISCSVNWESQTFNATTYIVFLFIFGLVIPLVVITYSYVNIILTMKMSAIRLGRKNRAEKRINVMVAIMIFAFLLAWTPYSVFALIEQFGPNDLITPKMAVLPALIAKSSICYNPLIYVGLNPQLRKSLKKQKTRDTTIIETTVNQISQNDDVTRGTDSTPKLKEKIKLTLNQHVASNNDQNNSLVNRLDQSQTSENNETNFKEETTEDNLDNSSSSNFYLNNNQSENQGNTCNGKHCTIPLEENDSSNVGDYKQETKTSPKAIQNNEEVDTKTSPKNVELEMQVFLDGKSKLIISDSYISNIC